MSRAPKAAGLALLAALIGAHSASCGGDECAPEDFAGGQACSPDDDRVVQSCAFNVCIEGPFCDEHYSLGETYCPSSAPTCRSSGPGTIVCVGDNVGPCTQAGFVRCDDAVTVVLCATDETGQLYLSRGVCAVGARCRDPNRGETSGPAGCDPAF